MNDTVKLTASAVNVIFTDCLFKEGEDTSDRVAVEGVVSNFGFHPARIESHREEIVALLTLLPKEFHEHAGGGYSFLNACMTNNGTQWGEHVNVEQLLVLGIGIGRAKILLPRDMWSAMPGGMPYFMVTAE